jgi:ribonuclease HI
MDLGKNGWKSVNWVEAVEDRVKLWYFMLEVMNFGISYEASIFQLIWVPVHEGIVGNETADQLARTGSDHPFTGPEPACGISNGVAKKAARDWMKRHHKKHWESTTGL